MEITDLEVGRRLGRRTGRKEEVERNKIARKVGPDHTTTPPDLTSALLSTRPRDPPR